MLAATSGAAAACAALIKQNVVDVFVFAIVATLTFGRRRAELCWWRNVAVFVAGAGGVVACALVGAAAQGTGPAPLWTAVVTFRVHASAVIGGSATGTTTQRLSHLLAAFAGSGLAPLLVLGVVALGVRVLHRRRLSSNPMDDPAVALVWPLLALVAWELIGVLGGGSYWLHYLTGLLPGLVLVVCLIAGRWGAHRIAAALLTAGLLYAVSASAVVWNQHVRAPVQGTPDSQVMSYLRGHAAASDGVLVAFGHPDIVVGSGLSSPYPQLWSLPVRVNDPYLLQFRQALSGPGAPRWVVVSGANVASWGLDATAAQHYLQGHYTQQASYGDWHVWQRDAAGR